MASNLLDPWVAGVLPGVCAHPSNDVVDNETISRNAGKTARRQGMMAAGETLGE